MVPKILHITNKELSETHKFILEQWKLTNPEFEIRFYNDLDNIKFLEDHFPQYIGVYNKIPKVISKVDFIRLLYLFKFGGVYVDCDVVPLKNIESLLNISEIVLFKEDDKNNKNFGEDFIISNAIIISTPFNLFIKKIIDEISINANFPDLNWNDPREILYLTGPMLFNKVYKNWKEKSQITILDGKYFNPMTHYELKNGYISNDIGFSYGVHLFEGSWWTENNYPKDIINKIIEKYQQIKNQLEFPLISCLCITKNSEELVKLSIDCFNKQLYPNKELIVVYEDNNKYIDVIVETNQQENIIFYKVDTNPKKTLGELRNISINIAKGEYIAQWDDDDWHSPLRLWEQFYYIKKSNKFGSILKSWLVFDQRNNLLYERKRTDLVGWEGTLLFKKSEIKNLYQNLAKGEDTGFVKQIESQIYPIYYPELYIYRVHYNNTWDYRKLKIDIIDPGTVYKDQSFITKLDINKKKVNKVLCFTTSYNRLKMLRGCIMDIKNQTYPSTYHSINVTSGFKIEKFNLKSIFSPKSVDSELLQKLFDDLISEKCQIMYSWNLNQHLNHIKAIKATNIDDYDVFVKIDDDDIYKKDYIQNIVDVFNNNDVDVISSKAIYQLNNNNVYKVNANNLGANPEGCDFKLPATFAFNRKALELIINIKDGQGFEDNMWRDAWCSQCKILEVDNTEQFIWHIHGKNISTSDFLKS